MDGLAGAARDVLLTAPAGLITDLDGTLSPIVVEAATARLAPGGVELLHGMVGRLAVVAVVTGRSAVDARAILGDVGRELLIVGNHGLEWLSPGAELPESGAGEQPVRAGLEAALARVPPLDGVAVEDKGLSATVHYRGAADPGRTRDRLLALLGQAPPGIELREGRLSVELRPLGHGNKGSAVARIVERYQLRGLVVAGDDVTDIDMFRTAGVLRRQGLAVLTLAVHGGTEVPPEVGDAADATVASPQALVRVFRAAIAPLTG
ncbi:MAG: trehalose-phosphatase [Chloroflexota bacterium]